MYLDPDPTYKSAESKYVLFNFHTESDIERLLVALCSRSPDRERAVALVGKEHSGRRYLAESALYRAQRRGERVHYSRIDLDGYELREGSTEKYVTHQLSKFSDERRSHVRAILDKMKVQLKLQGPSMWGISLVSVTLTAEMPVKEMLQALESTLIPAGDRSPRERFSLLLRHLAAEKRLVLHILDAVALASPVLEWLLDELAAGIDLLLLFSAGRQEDIALDHETVNRIELPLLSERQIRVSVDEHFSPNEFPEVFWRSLWTHSGGYPGALALKVADLMAADLLVEDRDGVWRLRQDAFASPEMVDVFGVDEAERVRLSIAALPEHIREHALQFVRMAALSGSAILVRPTALSVGIPKSGLDDFIDALDTGINPPVFEDLGYLHPSFPDELVYRFYNPVTAGVLLQRISSATRSLLANTLLDYLSSHKFAQTRGMARLSLELAQYCSDERRQQLQRSLSWWISSDEADDLTRNVRKSIASGRLDGETVLREVALHHRFEWPAYHSKALLDALVTEDGAVCVPITYMGEFYSLWAKVLFENGELRSATDVAQAGLALVTRRCSQAADMIQVLGNVKRRFGELSPALALYEEARDILQEVYGEDHRALLDIENCLAGLYKHLKRYAEAEALYQKSIAVLEASDEKLNLATCLDNLATVYLALGRTQEAESLSRRAVNIYVETIGSERCDTAVAQSNLALSCQQNGKLEEAAKLHEAAVSVFEIQLGPAHPTLALGLDNLGGCYEHLERWEDSETARLRSLAIYERALGHEAPDVAIVLSNLCGLYERRHRFDEAISSLVRCIEIMKKSQDTTQAEFKSHTMRLVMLRMRAKASIGKEPLTDLDGRD